MKRFWKTTAVSETEGGWTVMLDGRPIRTPAKAEAIRAEWDEQQDEVRPAAMPMMRLASTAIDLVAKRHGEVAREIAKYAETDLVCYRADHPPELARRQQESWGPIVDWAILRYDAPLCVTAGVIPAAQSAATLKTFAAAVAAYEPFTLTALHAATTACGSVVLGLALIERRLGAEDAYVLSQLDETFQIEQWGEDEEARRRRAGLRDDVLSAERFLSLLRR
jgi:chaperone required for assembly of F1-ATPase